MHTPAPDHILQLIQSQRRTPTAFLNDIPFHQQETLEGLQDVIQRPPFNAPPYNIQNTPLSDIAPPGTLTVITTTTQASTSVASSATLPSSTPAGSGGLTSEENLPPSAPVSRSGSPMDYTSSSPAPLRGELDPAEDVSQALNSLTVLVLITNSHQSIHRVPTSHPLDCTIAEAIEAVDVQPVLELAVNWTTAYALRPSAFSVIHSPTFNILSRQAIRDNEAQLEVIGTMQAIKEGAAGSLPALPVSPGDCPLEYLPPAGHPVFLIHVVEDVHLLLQSERTLLHLRRHFESDLSQFVQTVAHCQPYEGSAYVHIAFYKLCRRLFINLLRSNRQPIPPAMELHSSSITSAPTAYRPVNMSTLLHMLPMYVNHRDVILALDLGERLYRVRSLHSSTSSNVGISLVTRLLRHKPAESSTSAEERNSVAHLTHEGIVNQLSNLEALLIRT